MFKRIPYFVIAFLAFFVSCSDETTVFQDELQDDVLLENSEAKLVSSISYDKSGVLDIFGEDQLTNKSLGTAKAELAGDYPLTLVAQVKSPTYQGRDNLTASHVHVDGKYAYVSYNTAGEEYFGALDIIDVSNPYSPRITSRLFYINADMNSLQYKDGYLYAAGGVNAETSVTATSNSFVAKLAVANGKFNLGSGIVYGFQEGFNANDISIDNGKVLVTSGKDGSLTAYDQSDLSVLNEVPFGDLRSLSINNGSIALLNAGTGITIVDSNFQTLKEIPISSDLGLATKKIIDFTGDKIIVSEGNKGAGVYSYSTGSLLEYIPILINPDGVEQEDKVTNAVASNEGVLLMANGGAGLCLSEENGNAADLVGIIELEGSINYVASKGDYIFAASGREGLQIIKLNRPSASLEAECANTPEYEGSANLNVNQGEDLAYSGSKRFKNFSVSGNLLLCGSWTVKEAVNINSNALFAMSGSLVVARNNKRRNVTVDEGATLKIEGDLTIYGDLILNDGASLEFIGNDSKANIFGDVIKNGNVTITGQFEDLRDKF
ncbi:MAG: hypothetical protein WBM91_02325 [Eudoraea sp.]|jgi:hypothetical protein|uniref:hypothetical protein n=1 Tax=Eudoraea sp. TaxID=1979955 RepID=UPI003C77AFAF